MPMVEVTNLAAGVRGIGQKDGTLVLLDPGKTAKLDLTADEAAEIEGAGWWQIAAVKPAKADPVKVSAVKG